MTENSIVLLLQEHYELLRHYSSRLFQAWLSGVTVFVFIWPFLLRDSTERPIPNVFGMPDTAFTAVAAAGLLALVFLMGDAYYAKYLAVVRACASLERRLSDGVRIPLFSRSYPQLSHFPAYLFQVLSVLVLVAFGYEQGARGLWLLGDGLLLLSLIVYVVALESTLWRIRREADT